MDSNPTTRRANPQFWWARYVPVALLVLLLIVLVVFAGGPILVPLLVSFALAFMLEPVADWFQRRGRTRNAAVLLTLLTTTLAVLLIFVLLLPGIYEQFIESAEKLPLALRAAGSRVQGLLDIARERLSPTLFARLQGFINNFQQDPSAITSRLGGYLTQGLFGLVNLGSAALGLLIVPFFVYYLLLDMANLRRFVEEHVPERHRGVGARLFDEVGDVVRSYVRGRFSIALVLAAFYAVGLLILGVPLWAAIGLIAGIIGIIPYLGVISGMILALGFAALDGAGSLRLLGVVGVFLIAQPIEDYVLTPRLIGNKLELHPMLVFIALLVAGSLFGLLGLVLAIPVLGVLKVLLRFFDELYLRSDFYLAPASAAPATIPAETGTTTAVQSAAAETVSDAANAADARRAEITREQAARNK